MIIKFNEEELIPLSITADEACFLILYDRGYPVSQDVLEKLRKRPGVLIEGRVSRVILDRLQGSLALIESDKPSSFEELLEEYPKFDHLRPLHDVSSKLKAKYLKRVSNDPTLHKRIIEAIKRECDYREVRRSKGEFVEAWKSLSRYIETEGWNRYNEDLPKEAVTMTPGYGEREL
jgi:hypothetical protein